METQKVWLVCGANEGLGEAAVKYLLLRRQQVVAIPAAGCDEEQSLRWCYDRFPMADLRFINLFNAPETEKAVRQIVEQYGRIDKLINIGDCGLLSLHVLTAMQHAGKGHIIQMVADGIEAAEPAETAGLKVDYGHSEQNGILYTFLGPGLYFQSMLAQQTNHNS